MKSRMQIPKKILSQKNGKKFYTDYHFALQLYYIYKLESMPKKKPRLPLRDRRRLVIKRHRIFTLKPVSWFLNTDIFPLRKAVGWFSSQLNFSYINFLNK